jgi:hypothetical protein
MLGKLLSYLLDILVGKYYARVFTKVAVFKDYNSNHSKTFTFLCNLKDTKIRVYEDSTLLLLEQLPSRTPTTTVGEDAREKGTTLHCWYECNLVQPL